jgi:hypothetical protein
VASIGENSTSSQCPGLGHGGAGLALHVLAGGLELVLDVDVARRDEGVDARPLRVLDRVPRGVDVLRVRAREPADDRPVHLARYRLDGLEVTRRGDREAGLDDVHPKPRKLVRDLQLLLPVERDPGRLLPVAESRVEDLHSVVLGAVHVVPNSLIGLPEIPLMCGNRRPPRAIPPEGGGEEGVGGRLGTPCRSSVHIQECGREADSQV